MPIKVRYFASLKEQLGQAEAELQAAAPLTVREVWAQINPDKPLPDAVLTAINQHYANLDSVVKDGDELAFFPPVTGG